MSCTALPEKHKHPLFLASSPFLPTRSACSLTDIFIKLVFARKLGFDIISQNFLLLGKFQHFCQEREEKLSQNLFVWETIFFWEETAAVFYCLFGFLKLLLFVSWFFFKEKPDLWAFFPLCLSKFSSRKIFYHLFFWLSMLLETTHVERQKREEQERFLQPFPFKALFQKGAETSSEPVVTKCSSGFFIFPISRTTEKIFSYWPK